MKKKILKCIYPTLIILFLFLISGVGVIPRLNENQTLYFSSTLAQVSATLFGLTFTAYTFLEGKLSKDAENDDFFIDIAEELKTSYRHILLVGSLLTGIALFLCTGNILVGDYSRFITDGIAYRFLGLLLNSSFAFSIASIICSLYFTYKATDSKRVQKANKRLIKDNKYISNTPLTENEKNYLAEFLINYNRLEQLINSFVCDRKNIEHMRPVLNKSIYYLRNNGIIEEEQFVRLQEIRQFRNSLVHGDNPFVSESTFNVLLQLIKEIDQTLGSHKDNQ